MSLIKSLSEYLTSIEDISGTQGSNFSSAQSVGRYLVRNRSEAREYFRSLIADRIYMHHRPENAKDRTSLVISSVDEDYDYTLEGVTTTTEELLDCSIYGRGEGARDRVDLAAALFKLCVDGFYNNTWGDLAINECRIDGATSGSTAPDDGSDFWTYRRTVELQVFHSGPIPDLHS